MRRLPKFYWSLRHLYFAWNPVHLRFLIKMHKSSMDAVNNAWANEFARRREADAEVIRLKGIINAMRVQVEDLRYEQNPWLAHENKGEST